MILKRPKKMEMMNEIELPIKGCTIYIKSMNIMQGDLRAVFYIKERVSKIKKMFSILNLKNTS